MAGGGVRAPTTADAEQRALAHPIRGDQRGQRAQKSGAIDRRVNAFANLPSAWGVRAWAT